MEMFSETDGDVVVAVVLADELDADNAKWFKSKMSDIIGNNRKFVLDMRQVRFVDSSGCGALLSALRQISAAGGDLKLANVQKSVLSMFELVRLHRIVEMFDTREAAIKSFG